MSGPVSDKAVIGHVTRILYSQGAEPQCCVCELARERRPRTASNAAANPALDSILTDSHSMPVAGL